MFGKISIRNIPSSIWEGLEILAREHDRSTEAEARHALRAWVEPIMQRNERSARLIEVSARLRDLLEQVNKINRGRPIRPSHVAQAIGENYAEDVEKWFSGEKEPSFAQLDAVAGYLGGVSAWLQHGDQQAFPVEVVRISEDPAEGVEWLLDLNEPEKVYRLHLIREANKTGVLAIVKQYDGWRCKIYSTPYHVSAEIGAGGESSLAHLSVTLELLYKHYTKGGSGLVIKSYLLPEVKFRDLLRGQIHPLLLIPEAVERPWWEDFWDISQFKKQEYWPGWQSICDHIYQAVASRRYLQEQLVLIRAGTHPFFKNASIRE